MNRQFVGLSPDSIPLRDRIALTGKWIALEIYTPETLPLRLIAALGDTPPECVRQLRGQGLEPARYELSRLPSTW